ncbi:MAG: hypothetical protein ACI8PZ_001797 [Myxococcota bacterium]|jgi:hypothetical protein
MRFVVLLLVLAQLGVAHAQDQEAEAKSVAEVEATGLPVPPAPEPIERRPRTAPIAVALTGGVLAVGGGTAAGLTWAKSRQHVQAGNQEAWLALKPANNAWVGTGIAGGSLLVGGLGWAMLMDGGPRIHVGPRSVGASWTLR